MENAETQPAVEKITDPKSIENVKATIYTIEGLFHAMNAASFPLSWHDAVKRGMSFVNGLHTQLVAQLPQEVIDEMKAAKTPPPMAPDAPQANESPVQVVN